MNDVALPPSISKAREENWKRVEASGHEIDLEFIRRGFVSVKAEIDFMQKVFGTTSYDMFLEAQSSSEAFERFRAYDDDIRERLDAAQRNSAEAYDAMWDVILHDPRLPSITKAVFLENISRQKYHELIFPHIPFLVNSRKDEEKNICNLFLDSSVSLYEKSKSSLRKDVYNAVMADAYGALGFNIFKRKQGVDIYIKILTEEYAVFVEPDVVLMNKHYTQGVSDLAYWPQIPFSRVLYLGSPEKGNNCQYAVFAPTVNCVAATHLANYGDTRSFEVLIRANALWYELAVMPLEKAIVNR